MDAALVIILVLVALIVVVVVAFIAMYNKFARQRNTIEESWRQIDVELQRRHDLIGNLVEVNGFLDQVADHELVESVKAGEDGGRCDVDANASSHDRDHPVGDGARIGNRDFHLAGGDDTVRYPRGCFGVDARPHHPAFACAAVCSDRDVTV